MDKELVSVLMPVYNGVEKIGRALRSLEFQTYQNWKAIIVDDGSTDGTRALLEKYAHHQKYKIIYHPKNKGRGAARQTALENAEGQFIAFLDADDFYHPEKLQKQVEAFENHQTLTLVGCSLLSFNNKKDYKIRGTGDGSVRVLGLREQVRFVAPSSMIRLSDAQIHKYNTTLNASEDTDFIKRVLTTKTYALLPDILYYYEVEDFPDERKLIEYYKNGVVRYYSNFKEDRRSIVLLTKAIFKLIIAYVLRLFGKLNIIIDKRGKPASNQQIREFLKVKEMV